MNFSKPGESSMSSQQLFNQQELSEDPPFDFSFATSGTADGERSSPSQPVSSLEVSNAIGNVAGNAYLTAATTDLAMAVDKVMASRDLYADLQLYLPTEASDLRHPLTTLLKVVDKDYDLGGIMLLPARMQFGMRMAAKLAADPKDKRISGDVFADAWKHIASGMLEATGLCDHVQKKYGKQIYDLSLPAGLLSDVLSGKHPCLDRDGRLSVPNWAERRGSKRYPCQVEVSVVSDRQTQSGTVANFSAEGLGITGLNGFEINEKVTVKRLVGDDITGRIQRADEELTGVAMDKGLIFDDPLYNLISKDEPSPQ